jgi:serine phosphatase RsbU (regulator of sigma subunit)
MSPSFEALREVLNEADTASADALPAVVHNALTRAGVRGVAIYLLDYGRTHLQPVPGCVPPSGAYLPHSVDEGEVGRTYRERRSTETSDQGSHRIRVPISERAECLGVLELELDEIDDAVRELSEDVGVLLGHLLVTAHRYTDVYDLLRRRQTLNLASEMHWEIQPALSYVGPSISIAGGIEPAYEIGGDVFDYSINEGVLDFAILDAMGHGLEAALLSTQAIEAYRYGRRRGQSLLEIVDTLEYAFVEQFDASRFVTGLLCRLDCHTGAFSWVNAAHLPPLLMRAGRIVGELESPPRCPLGLGISDRAQERAISLQPGDGVVLYSDGVVEARSENGEDFALDRLCDLIERGANEGHQVDAVLRMVLDEVTAHSAGPLRDDASLVMLGFTELRA